MCPFLRSAKIIFAVRRSTLYKANFSIPSNFVKIANFWSAENAANYLFRGWKAKRTAAAKNIRNAA